MVALGAYHGLNPAMGWPLAVAGGLTERRTAAVLRCFVPLAGGHFLAMAMVLLPFAALSALLAWQQTIRLAAGVAVAAFGAWKLVRPGHPRALARVRPTQLALWSFLMATAHGAGLMLLPFGLGLCASGPVTPALAAFGALQVAAVHSAVMVAAGAAAALAVYRWFGLGLLSRAWLDLDRVWAASLLIAGAASVGVVLAERAS